MAALDRLSSILSSVQLHFKNKKQKIVTEKSPFRLSILNQDMVEKIYQEWKPSLELAQQKLLKEDGFLTDWKKVNDTTLAQRLLDFSLELYKPAGTIPLSTLLRYEDLGAEERTASLTQGVLPLLRVSFDHLGVGYSTLENFFVVTEGKGAEIYKKVAQAEEKWQPLESNTPYAVFCVQVRQMIPLEAMVHFQECGEKAHTQFKRITDKEQEESR